ncbi:MAG: NAD(P)H-dependent oxidoreductase [Vicinamibacterales bacterium]
MRAVLLAALPSDQSSTGRLTSVVKQELVHAGYDRCDAFDLTSTPLAFCQGEFDCWAKTPGRCRAQDAETRIVQAVHDADALVFLDAITFGGHGHVLKTAVDRLLCLLEPFFTTRHALTHHTMRYATHQRLFSIGWLPTPDRALAETFAELTDANAVNYLSPACGTAVVDAEHEPEWPTAIRAMFEHTLTPGASITARAGLRRALLAAAAPDPRASEGGRIRRTSLLIGSPKAKGTSASEVLVRAIDARLSSLGVATNIHVATEFVHARASALASAADVVASDLFFLVTPLYVDALPSLTTHALELVAGARAQAGERTPMPRFAMLINCGFPEAEQTRTAMRIARHFADQAGYLWAGGLPLGGGGVITPATVLDKPAGPVTNIVRALDQAVPSLAETGAVSHESIETMATSVLPDIFYRMFGDVGWRWQAHRHGLAQRDLHARPLDQP